MVYCSPLISNKMRNVFFLLVLPLLLMLGCTKEQFDTNTSTGTQNMEKSSQVTLINFSATSRMIETISVEDLKNNSLPQLNPRTSSNSSVNGHFSPIPMAEVYVTISGMKNNSGVHGNGQVKSSFLDFNMQTECLTVVGNEAIYGGVITQVNYVDPAWILEFCDCIHPGVHFVLKVIDNGEGQNAPPDMTATYFMVGDHPLCEDFPVTSPYWAGQMIDVQGQGDQIQVK